ncbi:restriction endonuclease subunit S [Macrococcoides caseolyticum]|uniref:restriction endonuclease subunit S n=1 Tax=Macrococcoides caseolyticum TaxID=69966 RepID=UPI000C334956|nr:restriction endonuclease subunit S [Macrococcus caseolyticus]PKE74242.1 restriction endonuclease subunit S [Macrococcus caseolyticus]
MFLKNVNKHYNLGKDTYTWEQRELGEVVDFSIKTNSLSRANLSQDSGEIKNIHYGDILVKFNSVLDLKTEKLPFINSEYSTLDKFQFLKDGDLVFADAAEDNSVGKCIEVRGVLDDKVTSGLHTIAGTPKMNFASFYLGYYLNSNNYHDKILPLIQGTKVSSISKNNLTKSIINYPKNFEEQQKIGKLFIEIDQTITLLQRKINNLNKVKKGLLQKLFPTKQSINPRIRFNGFNQDWEQRKLSDLLNKNSEKNKNLSVINVESVSNKTGFTKQTDQFEDYSVASADLSNYYVIREKQFAYNPSRINVGSIAYKDLGDEISVVSPLYVSFSTKKILNDGFLWNWFKTASFDAQRQRLSEGSVRDTLSFNQLSEMNTMFPTYPEQQKIGSFFKQLDNTIALLQKELEMNKQIKKGFLQKLFPKE